MKSFISRRVGVVSGLGFFLLMAAFYAWRGFPPMAIIIGPLVGAFFFGACSSFTFRKVQQKNAAPPLPADGE